MKEALGSTDEEWKALEPLIQRVQQLQRNASTRRMMFRFGPGGPPPGGSGGPGGGPGGAPSAAPGGPGDNPGARPGGDQPPSLVQQSAADLQDLLSNKDASPEEIKAKMSALRDARAKAKADLAKAQDELRELLTARQEAALVMFGVLE